MTPELHGHELAPGDELGHDTTPDCCDEAMSSKGTLTGYRHFECDDCSTILTVSDPTGLVFDIR